MLTSFADIAILVFLLAIVSLYTGAHNQITFLLPGFAKKTDGIVLIALIAIAFICKNFLSFLVFKNQSQFFFEVASRLSREKLINYLNSNYEEYVAADRAKIFNLVNYRPIEFAQNILTSIQIIFTETTIILITVLGILIFKPTLFFLLILFLLPPILLSAAMIRKKLNYIKQNILHDSEKANQYLNETFSGFIESNIYDSKHFFTKRHSFYQKKLSTHLSQLQIAQWLPSRIVEIFAVIGLFVLILLNQIMGAHSDLIDIGAFLAAAYKIMPGISRIANASALIKTYGHVITDLNQKNLEETKIEHISNNEPIKSICLHNVCFDFKNKKTIQNVNLEIRTGDFVCISGASGKGKTTLINILLGLLTPNEGYISYNGEKLEPEQIKNYYPKLSYIKQQTLLIHDSIQTNITLSDDAIDQQRLSKAIEFAGLEQLIDNCPQGLQTIIADDGKNISGGQKQRIALARALYHNSDLLIFDEPFNELDKNSEISLLQKLKTLSESGKIIILVSHSNLCLDFCTKRVEIN